MHLLNFPVFTTLKINKIITKTRLHSLTIPTNNTTIKTSLPRQVFRRSTRHSQQNMLTIFIWDREVPNKFNSSFINMDFHKQTSKCIKYILWFVSFIKNIRIFIDPNCRKKIYASGLSKYKWYKTFVIIKPEYFPMLDTGLRELGPWLPRTASAYRELHIADVCGFHRRPHGTIQIPKVRGATPVIPGGR